MASEKGQHSPEHEWQMYDTTNEQEQKVMRGGSREQHVNAGRAGGKAPHKCRGRQCSKESKE